MSSYAVIESGKYNVLALGHVADDFSTTFPALTFLQTLASSAQYGASAKGFKKLFQRYADGGRSKLTAELFHEVDKDKGIWEFVKGDLRLFCFVIGNNVILTNGTIKKSQKVDQAEVSIAIRCKAQFRLNH
ncbi:hypothetical protein GTP45_14440 [Pseudoduganella sp. FT55W]|uniref:Uncharacterized protein n=1 Tax=Duganella rivi TaxID=2666083 RepID=A0A7X4KCB2_9BURK|nr:type II toxin-antitoxin system RelE/ParE family toxin [Duganella rivi]MYM68020.1 hypothetical protein [Duganella rivi]